MKQRSRFVKIQEYLVGPDRRGNERIIKRYTGFNKGKRYPYRSIKRGAKTDGWHAITG